MTRLRTASTSVRRQRPPEEIFENLRMGHGVEERAVGEMEAPMRLDLG